MSDARDVTVSGEVVVDVTLVSLRVSASMIGRALLLLDERERTLVATRTGDARRRYLAAHAAARVVLGERLGTDPASVSIGSEPGGRPIVGGIAFSLTHSAELAAVAIAAPDRQIGIDVERVRSRTHLDRLAQRVFDPEPYARWHALPERDRTRAFAARWTEVEALLKARGTGIAAGLASASDLPPGWSCTAIDAGAGYVGALAADASPITIRSHAFRLGDALTRRDGTAR